MSVDKSLKSKTALVRARSVLTRIERLSALEEDGRWSDGDSVFGLPKVRTLRPKRRKKVGPKKEEAEAEGEAPAAAPEPEATP